MEEPNQNQKLRTKEIKGVIFLALAVFLLLCLFSYSPQDPSFTHAVPPDGPATHNLTGKVGSYTADSLIRLLGFASFLIPLALLAGAFNFFLNPSFNLDKSRLGGFSFTLSLAGLLGALIRGGVTFSGEKLKAGGLSAPVSFNSCLAISIRRAPTSFNFNFHCFSFFHHRVFTGHGKRIFFQPGKLSF